MWLGRTIVQLAAATGCRGARLHQGSQRSLSLGDPISRFRHAGPAPAPTPAAAPHKKLLAKVHPVDPSLVAQKMRAAQTEQYRGEQDANDCQNSGSGCPDSPGQSSPSTDEGNGDGNTQPNNTFSNGDSQGAYTCAPSENCTYPVNNTAPNGTGDNSVTTGNTAQGLLLAQGVRPYTPPAGTAAGYSVPVNTTQSHGRSVVDGGSGTPIEEDAIRGPVVSAQDENVAAVLSRSKSTADDEWTEDENEMHLAVAEALGRGAHVKMLRDSGGRHAPEYDFERSHWGDESENRPRSWRDYDWPEDDQAEGVDDDLGYGPALVEHEEDEPMLGGHAIFLSEDAEDYKHETEEWGEPEWEEEMDDVSDVEERRRRAARRPSGDYLAYF